MDIHTYIYTHIHTHTLTSSSVKIAWSAGGLECWIWYLHTHERVLGSKDERVLGSKEGKEGPLLVIVSVITMG